MARNIAETQEEAVARSCQAKCAAQKIRKKAEAKVKEKAERRKVVKEKKKKKKRTLEYIQQL